MKVGFMTYIVGLSFGKWTNHFDWCNFLRLIIFVHFFKALIFKRTHLRFVSLNLRV